MPERNIGIESPPPTPPVHSGRWLSSRRFHATSMIGFHRILIPPQAWGQDAFKRNIQVLFILWHSLGHQVMGIAVAKDVSTRVADNVNVDATRFTGKLVRRPANIPCQWILSLAVDVHRFYQGDPPSFRPDVIATGDVIGKVIPRYSETVPGFGRHNGHHQHIAVILAFPWWQSVAFRVRAF